MHIADQKEALRTAVKERLKHMNTEERAAEGRSISRRLLEQIPEGSTVCAYYAMPTEANIQLFLQTHIDRGDPLYLPCFEDQKLVFRQCDDLTTLIQGPLNTMDPHASCPELEPSQAEYILVPGLAFDHAGHRLGRGNGGYDRWFSNHAEALTNAKIIGIALDCQIEREVPAEEHDQVMHAVATPREWIKI